MSKPIRGPMNAYDQSARFIAKADPVGFFRWLVPGLPPGLEFQGWLDTRTLPFPGESDRTSDTVAELFDPLEPRIRWALVTEFQAEPDAEILDRLLEYLARLRRELRHGPRRRDKFRVAAGLVHLTGSRSADTLDMTLPGDSTVGLRLTIASKALREQDAALILAEIAAGGASRWLLPWAPLMKNGGKPTIVEEWARLASAEPNPLWRSNYAALALIFAELTRHQALWKKTLEGWNVKTSPIIEEWKAEGRAEGRAEGQAIGRREDLLQLLSDRFSESLPTDLVAAMAAETDLKKLSEAIRAVLKSASIEEFRAISGL
jgi:hypothetical protein